MDQQIIDNSSVKDSHGNITLDSAGNSLRSSLSLGEKEEEGRDELLLKLLSGLTVEKVVQMMTVRKGKVNRYIVLHTLNACVNNHIM